MIPAQGALRLTFQPAPRMGAGGAYNVAHGTRDVVTGLQVKFGNEKAGFRRPTAQFAAGERPVRLLRLVPRFFCAPRMAQQMGAQQANVSLTGSVAVRTE